MELLYVVCISYMVYSKNPEFYAQIMWLENNVKLNGNLNKDNKIILIIEHMFFLVLQDNRLLVVWFVVFFPVITIL